MENRQRESQKSNPINPEHYNRLKPEPKDVIRSWGLNFNMGNAVKYIARAGHKGDIVEDLKKAQQYLQFEIDALEAGQEPKHEDKLDAMLYGLDPVLKSIVRGEACTVKPIVVELPEGVDIEEVMENIRKGVGTVITPEPKQPTEFEKKALDLYNAYLYRLSEISKEMSERRKGTPPNLGMCSRFVQNISLREGFDPTEVLDGMTEKLMEDN